MKESLSFELEEAPSADDPAIFAQHVEEGLGQDSKSLPSRYLYDAEGSRLFEEICKQGEYYPTPAEREILLENGEAILDGLGGAIEIVELGSGNSEKTHHLLVTACASGRRVTYVPVDICREIIEEAAESLTAEIPGLAVRALAAEYNEALEMLRDGDLTEDHGPRAILWLGSNIGNMTRAEGAEFLTRIRGCMRPEDRLLCGIDLRKEKSILEAAYDDAAGVTASFSLNLLRRINRELKANFDLEAFRHVAEYDTESGSVMIYLESQRSQEVRIGDLNRSFSFEKGERIHTEYSNKYSIEEIRELAADTGFALEQTWFDGQGYYSLNRLRPI